MRRESTSVINLTLTGLFAAMITLMTAYIFHIPYGANGGYIHFGDTLIYLAATLLPKPYAIAAAAIGGGLADLLTAPMWVPATILIKVLLTLPFTSNTEKMLSKRNSIAPLFAALFSIAGYYLAEGVIFGSFASAFVSIWGNVVQSLGSMAIFLVFATALDRVHLKARTNLLAH